MRTPLPISNKVWRGARDACARTEELLRRKGQGSREGVCRGTTRRDWYTAWVLWWWEGWTQVQIRRGMLEIRGALLVAGRGRSWRHTAVKERPPSGSGDLCGSFRV